MGKLILVDEGELFFLQIMDGTRVLGRASMGVAELKEAANRFRQAALSLEVRKLGNMRTDQGPVFLPSGSSRTRLR